MTKKKINKGGEKDEKTAHELGEMNDTETTELADAASCAASPCTEPNPSTADLMKAITALSQNVDTKFTTISDAMGAMQTTLATMSGKVRDMEEAVNGHEDRLTSLENLCKSLQESLSEQRNRLVDLESRSRRQNIRIIGVPEGTEKGKPVEFITKLIPALLGAEHFNNPALLVDRAHRSLGPKPADGARPRPLIVRLHYCQTWELILKLAAQKSPLQHNGSKLFFFPDLTAEVLNQHRAFNEARQMCRAAGFRYGFLHPARFRVTVEDVTRTFNNPDEAEVFLRDKINVPSS